MTGSYTPALPGPDSCPGCGAARLSSPEAEQLGLHQARASEKDAQRAGLEDLPQVGQRVSAAEERRASLRATRTRARAQVKGLARHFLLVVLLLGVRDWLPTPPRMFLKLIGGKTMFTAHLVGYIPSALAPVM